MARLKIPKQIETKILTSTKRRCPLCYFVDYDRAEKKGQIAHLNRNREDHRYENLVWLCLVHHSEFDSKTSQHKNYTVGEIREYRDQLANFFENENPSEHGRNKTFVTTNENELVSINNKTVHETLTDWYWEFPRNRTCDKCGKEMGFGCDQDEPYFFCTCGNRFYPR